jgi:hypothetical protein
VVEIAVERADGARRSRRRSDLVKHLVLTDDGGLEPDREPDDVTNGVPMAEDARTCRADACRADVGFAPDQLDPMARLEQETATTALPQSLAEDAPFVDGDARGVGDERAE